MAKKQSRSLSIYPILVSEWHPTKNGNLKPDIYAKGSHKVVWWKCSKDDEHEWEQEIRIRSSGSPCPFCSGKRVDSKNNLAFLFPEIAKEWHPTKNEDLKPDQVTPGSSKRVWWKCSKDDEHEWKKETSKRINGSLCPFCSGKRVDSKNNLAFLFPEIAKEWHPTKNEGLKPEMFTTGSDKVIWWKCSRRDDHKWPTSIYHRVQGTTCPYCSGNKVGKDNNFLFSFPEIAKEWHPTKNGDLKPENFTAHSGKSVWWKCSRRDDHEWKAKISHRASGSGCKKCSNQTSRPEIRILTELMSLFVGVEWREKVFDREVDIFITELKLAIEYDGSFWHDSREVADLKKNSAFASENIRFLRIRQAPLKKLSKTDLILNNHPLKKSDLNLIVTRIETLVSENVRESCNSYRSKANFVNSHLYDEYLANLPSPPLIRSFLSQFPEISKEWHPTKNGTLTPRSVYANAAAGCWWKCPKGEDHEWSRSPNARAQGSGCPFCSGKRVSQTNNFALLSPEIAKEWHPTKNGDLKPENFTASSGKVVWWRCLKKDEHEWDVSISNRFRHNTGCPFCKGNRADSTNNIAVLFPEIAKEWHPRKNGDLKPEMYKQGSVKIVWWKCSQCDSEWEKQICARTQTNQIGCSDCRKLSRKGK